jgi:hypothetical protein
MRTNRNSLHWSLQLRFSFWFTDRKRVVRGALHARRAGDRELPWLFERGETASLRAQCQRAIHDQWLPRGRHYDDAVSTCSCATARAAITSLRKSSAPRHRVIRGRHSRQRARPFLRIPATQFRPRNSRDRTRSRSHPRLEMDALSRSFDKTVLPGECSSSFRQLNRSVNDGAVQDKRVFRTELSMRKDLRLRQLIWLQAILRNDKVASLEIG